LQRGTVRSPIVRSPAASPARVALIHRMELQEWRDGEEIEEREGEEESEGEGESEGILTR
jgi:hypothetical protein